MDGLEPILRAANVLHGERNSPELPIPTSAISAYTKRFKMSDSFGNLIHAYDMALRTGLQRTKTEIISPDGSSEANKVTKKVL